MAGKPEGKKPLGRSRRRWEDNVKIDLPRITIGALTLHWAKFGVWCAI
jgi:hypothetical protein